MVKLPKIQRKVGLLGTTILLSIVICLGYILNEVHMQKSTPEINIEIGSILKEVNPKGSKPIISGTQKGASDLFEAYAIDSESLVAYGLQEGPDGGVIAIIIPRLGYEVDVVKGYEKRIATLQEDSGETYKDYIGKVVLEQYGMTNYLILVISNNAENTYKDICAKLENLE